MPVNIGRLLADAGGNFDDETLAQNLRNWEASVIDALEKRHPGISETLKYNTRLPLDKLPVREQARLMQQYRSIIGLDFVLNTLGQSGTAQPMSLKYLESNKIMGGMANKVAQIWDALAQVRSMDSGNAYARFPVDVRGDSLINRVYSNINLQFRPKIIQGVSGIIDPKRVPPAAANYFTLGRSSIPTVSALQGTRTSVPNLAGKAVTIFDIETAGLVKNQIREIAFQTMTGDSAGALRGGTAQQINLRPHQFARGVMYHAGQNMDLEQFMHSKFGVNVAGMRASNGNDFINAVMPFLRTIEQSDYIVGHNIAEFDIGQIFSGLAGTNRYQNEQQFRDYVDMLHEKTRTSTIDTLELVRSNKNLENLTLSKYLGTEGKVFSIQNLLLKTNLATIIGPERLAEAMGYNAATGTFAKGLHFGDVDTLVTSALLNNMEQIRVKSDMRAGFRGSRLHLMRKMHGVIVSSSALTPTTNITNVDNILPGLVSYFDQGVGITPLDQLIYSQRNLGFGVKAHLTQSDLNPHAMATRVKLFDRFKHLGVEGMRQKLAANFTPFAGLSIEERALGTSLARATAGSLSVGRQAAELSADALISRFELFNPESIQYSTFTGRSSIPAQILEDMGLLSGNTQNPTMLKLSAVNSTIYDDKRAVNLVFGFQSQEQVQALADRLRYLAANPEHFTKVMGLAEDQNSVIFNRFRRAVQETDLVQNIVDGGLEKGVSIAQLYGDPRMVDDVFNILSEHTLRDVDKLDDVNTFKYALPFMDIDEGTVRTAGVVLDKFLTEQDNLAIGQSVAQARDVYERGYMGMMGNREARTFAQILDSKPAEVAERSIRAMNAYVTDIRPHLGKLTLGGIAGGTALLLYKRKREQDRYDVAVDRMPTEGARRYAIADQLQARIDTGYDGYRQQIDPLATASIVSNLHATRLGHTNMGWDRNTNLYGGVL